MWEGVKAIGHPSRWVPVWAAVMGSEFEPSWLEGVTPRMQEDGVVSVGVTHLHSFLVRPRVYCGI